MVAFCGLVGRRVAARLQLLGDEPGIALELEAAVGRHAVAGNDEEASGPAAPASPDSATPRC